MSIAKRLKFSLGLAALSASLAGCGGGSTSAGSTGNGLPPLPERPGPTQAEQRARFLQKEGGGSPVNSPNRPR